MPRYRGGFVWVGVIVSLCAGCGGSGTPADAGPDAPPPVDQCLSASDRALLATVYDAGLPDGGVGDAGLPDAGAADGGVTDPITIGADCAKYDCLSELLLADPAPGYACMQSCFEASPMGPLSDGCQTCYIEAIYCTGNACPKECLGTDVSLCTACLDMYCRPRLDACTGL